MIKVPYTSAHYPKSNKDQKRLCAQNYSQINLFTTHVLEKETWDKLEENVSDILEDAKLLAPNEAGLIKESSSYVTSSQGIYGGIYQN